MCIRESCRTFEETLTRWNTTLSAKIRGYELQTFVQQRCVDENSRNFNDDRQISLVLKILHI